MHFSSSLSASAIPRRHSTLAAVACITLLSPHLDSLFRANQSSKSMARLDCAAVKPGMASEQLEPQPWQGN